MCRASEFFYPSMSKTLTSLCKGIGMGVGMGKELEMGVGMGRVFKLGRPRHIIISNIVLNIFVLCEYCVCIFYVIFL